MVCYELVCFVCTWHNTSQHTLQPPYCESKYPDVIRNRSKSLKSIALPGLPNFGKSKFWGPILIIIIIYLSRNQSPYRNEDLQATAHSQTHSIIISDSHKHLKHQATQHQGVQRLYGKKIISKYSMGRLCILFQCTKNTL